MAKFIYKGKPICFVRVSDSKYAQGYRRYAAVDTIKGRVLIFLTTGQKAHLDKMKNACLKELGQCEFVELPKC